MDQPVAGQPDVPNYEARTFGDVTLVRGDCLAVMPTLTPSSVAMVFADLPYGITFAPWDRVLNCEQVFSAISPLLRPDATIAMSATQPFATDLINANRKNFKYEIIWHCVRPKGHLLANLRPMRLHENILIFAKRQIYNPQKIQGLPSGKKTRKPSFLHGQKSSTVVLPNVSGMKHPTSVLKVDETEIFSSKLQSKRLHPTQKPVALLEWLIATYTNPGDLILDPVAGSGTTGIAALNLGRRAILIEKDPTYFEAMCKRIAEHQQKTAAASK